MAAEDTSSSIILAYRRVGNLSSGFLTLVLPGEHDVVLERFEELTFNRMLTSFARELKSHPMAFATILRIDRPGFLPYRLDEETTNLFRTDPVSAIRSMTFELPTVGNVKVAKEENKPLEVEPIRVGYDTLADSFGDVVYTRNRNSVIECPGCGYWGVAHTILNQTLFQCSKVCATSGYDINLRLTLSNNWAGVEVKDLLATPLKKFYFPRPWNDGSWITRAELIEKYTAFTAEKECACSAIKATQK